MLIRQVHLKNVLFVTIGIFLKKDLSFNHLSVSNDVLISLLALIILLF